MRAIQPAIEGRPQAVRRREVLKLTHWTCYSCGLELADRLKRIRGVSDVSLNFFTEQIAIEHDGAALEEVRKAFEDFGLQIATGG